MKKLIVLLLLVGLGLGACRPTRYVPVTEYRDSLVVLSRTDSVRVIELDSIYIREGGDTVFVERWKTQIRERFRERVDTVVLTSVKEVPYPVVKEVPAKLTEFQRFCVLWFWIIVVGLLGFVVVKYRGLFKTALKFIIKIFTSV